MSNDAARHELADVLALVQEQMSDLAAVQKKQAALTAHGSAAEGTVEVTVNAQGMVVETVVDESYLDDFEFADLGEHITAAAQSAAREVARRSAELLVPLTERRKSFPSLSDIAEGAPDFRDLIPEFNLPTDAGAPPNRVEGFDGGDDDWGDPAYPNVRR